jgi:hypothetical protein
LARSTSVVSTARFATGDGGILYGRIGQYEWDSCVLNVPLRYLVSWSPKRLEMVAISSYFHCELDICMYVVKMLMELL